LRSSPPAVRRLLVATGVDSAGTGLFLSASAVFFTRYCHLSVGQVGAGLSVGALAGLLGTLPLGYLADRYAPRNVIVWICVWRAACFVGYVFVNSFPLFIIIAACQGAAERGIVPVRQAIIAYSVDEGQRPAAAALLRTVQNASFTAGAGVATAALATASRTAFVVMTLGNAGSFIAAAIAVLGIPAGTATAGAAAERHEASRRATALLRGFAALTGGLRDRRFITLAGLNGLLTLHNSLLVIGIPLWIVAGHLLPVAVVPALTLLNTILVVLLQVAVASAAKTMRDAGRCMLWAGAALAGGCVVVGVSAGPFSSWMVLALLVVAVICLTIAELYRSAGGWQIALAHAHGDSTARYLAVFSLGSAAEAFIGPALFADAIVSSGAVGWWVIAGVFGLAGVIAWRLTLDGSTDAPAQHGRAAGIPARHGGGQAASTQAASTQAASTQAASTQAGSTQAGSTQAGSTQAGSTEPGQQ
jgi:MFS family permease